MIWNGPGLSVHLCGWFAAHLRGTLLTSKYEAEDPQVVAQLLLLLWKHGLQAKGAFVTLWVQPVPAALFLVGGGERSSILILVFKFYVINIVGFMEKCTFCKSIIDCGMALGRSRI